MNDDWLQPLSKLLTLSRIAFLATQGEDGPESSMAPFALFRGNVLLHLSRLARHANNVARNPRIGVMICTTENPAASPLALPRVSLSGEVMAAPESDLTAARSAYLERIPEAEPLFNFQDFQLFQVRIIQARWVGGFGKARTLSAQKWYGLFAPTD